MEIETFSVECQKEQDGKPVFGCVLNSTTQMTYKQEWLQLFERLCSCIIQYLIKYAVQMHARTSKLLIIRIVLECAKIVCYTSEVVRYLKSPLSSSILLSNAPFLSCSCVEVRCGVGEQRYHTEPFNGAGAAHGGPVDPGKRQRRDPARSDLKHGRGEGHPGPLAGVDSTERRV